MEKKTRPLTLAGGIVNIVFAALDILVMIIAIFVFANEAAYLYEMGYDVGVAYTAIYITCIIEILFAVTILILASITIAKNSKSVKEYNRYSGLVITLFVFDCLAVLSLFILMCQGSYLSILSMLVYAMCGTFVLVDLCRNKKALKNLNAPSVAQQTSVVDATPVVQSAPQIVEAPVAQTTVAPVVENSSAQTPKLGMSKLYQNLTELKGMKDEGIISEEEYKKLKAKVIDKAEF